MSANGITITCVRRNEAGRWAARVTTADHETFDAELSGGWQIIAPDGGRKNPLANVAARLSERMRQAERAEQKAAYEATIESLSSKQLMALEVLRAHPKATVAWLKERRIAVSLVEALVEKKLVVVERPDLRDREYRVFVAVDAGKLAR